LLLLFEDYLLDTNRRELRRGSSSVPVQPQVFDLLAFLVGNRDRVVTRDDLLGSVWGGRIVSESTVASRINAARHAVGDGGQQQRLIRTIIGRGFRFMGEVQERSVGTEPANAFAPPRLSIVVLPFRNLSKDPHLQSFADGITDNVTTDLSRIANMLVIARNKAFSYRERSVDAHDVGRELGVRYVLEGSVQHSGRYVRVIAQLIDTETAAVLRAARLDQEVDDQALWNFQYDKCCRTLLDAQDQLSEALMRSIAPRIRVAEVQRLRVKRLEDYGAYDYCLHAQQNMRSSDRAVFESACSLFARGIALDPHNVHALAWHSFWHVMWAGQGWSLDRERDAALAERIAQRAIDCGNLRPMPFAAAGLVSAYFRGNFDTAFKFFEKAIATNSNCARAWLWNADAHAWTGDGPNAVAKITRAMALSYYDPLGFTFSASASLAYLADHQYLRSVEFGLECLRENPAYSAAYTTMIPALVMAGQEAEARAKLQQLMRLEPDFTIEDFRRHSPCGAHPIGDLCCEALARAGAPLAGETSFCAPARAKSCSRSPATTRKSCYQCNGAAHDCDRQSPQDRRGTDKSMA
jgi:TolB-like protein